jgi:hypothetical protein
MRGVARLTAALTAAARAQDAAPPGYSHAPAASGAQAAAGAWHGADAYAQAPAQSAAAEFVERSDPPKIRVVVRKRPLNQKARRPLRQCPHFLRDCNENDVSGQHTGRAWGCVTVHCCRAQEGRSAGGGGMCREDQAADRPALSQVSAHRRPLTDGRVGGRQEVERGEEDAVEVDMGEARLVVNEPRAKVRPGRAVGGAVLDGDRLLLQPSLPAQARLSASPGARYGRQADARLLACGSGQQPRSPA